MPVFKTIELDDGKGWICVWKTNEKLPELESKLQNNCLLGVDYSRITHENKKIDYLASRCALDWVLEKMLITQSEIIKDTNGKPFLKNSNAQLSISHSNEYCVAIVHQSRNVGIDIQILSHKIKNVSTKFLTPSEIEIVGDQLLDLCKVWCAKEAMYKLVGKKGLSLKNDFNLIAIENVVQMAFQHDYKNNIYTFHNYAFDGYVMVYVVE